ncbi:hypothetical protein [uncultured Marixanthomonas sp.]|uniref:hypothetical protein n=1 Tax=uncultured Marixanthomonas sp. TaxID=757245 RepID=UPI0030DB18E9|tara:strand:- start:1610 stop:1849 length:240 start_codon:yes stop_codon:yes gene_type:complete
MNTFIKYFFIALVISSLVLYVATIKEGVETLDLEGGYFKNIGKTFEYFFLWVIPYWWYILIGASTILGVIAALVIKKLK